MKEIIKMFENEKIRLFVIENIPYFSLSDICKILGMTNPSHAINYIKKDYIRTTYIIDSMKRRQEIYIINEYGLYELLFKSRKEEAGKFREWVFEEVLPSIRKTGKYSIPDEIKKMSTKNRNILTSEWQSHGIQKPHEYIQLTLQEYKVLSISDKRKRDLNRGEMLLLNALESMEALKLFNNENINGYSDCKESLIDTSKKVKLLKDKNKQLM
jgi:prophage antirepressor-like protein